ncbi:uncharacterized protein LOC127744125 [Arachis duranensis]|uniref:Uncharacterized protein LOC107461913 n=1 Tax=Arachis duranensis TaxID=130453 RepID=A0A6P4BVR6_ARADU|nr:uncharacterized protein LOC107461913 [Arachis duranensis]XP_020999425.1 uncharacterized protein LOC110281476 [Arachis duranensis]XP_052112357.1 uncharacterized protein LOC127744125 [Arachis duranensis]
MTLSELKMSILQKVGLCGSKWVKKLFYKILIAVVSAGVQYETFVIGSDEDMPVLFHCRCSFLKVRIHELFAKLEDGFDSSGASAPNPQSMTVGGTSTSMPVVAAGGLLAEPPSIPLAAARSPGLIPGLFGESEPDHIENLMQENDLDDEPDHILGDSKEDTPRTPPARPGPSSSCTGQQPPHFSTLNVEAIGQHLDMDPTSGRQGLHEGNPSGDFQVSQSFQTKEEAVLSVKDYSICRGVQYRVMESDHLKFHGRCKEFGNGCTWLIRITLR